MIFMLVLGAQKTIKIHAINISREIVKLYEIK